MAMMRLNSVSPCLSLRILYPSDTRLDLNSSGLRRPVLFLSKWLNVARNSFNCSAVMPFESRVRIWFSTSFVKRRMDVSSCSQPTRRVCGGEQAQATAMGRTALTSIVYCVYRFSKIRDS